MVSENFTFTFKLFKVHTLHFFSSGHGHNLLYLLFINNDWAGILINGCLVELSIAQSPLMTRNKG